MEDRQLLAVITVTSLADNLTVDGQVTLREAILAANTDTSVDGSTKGSGADTIQFSPNLAGQTIRLSVTGDNTFGLSALRISSPITIVGDALRGITIDRATGSEQMRLFYVDPNGNLTLQNMTLSGGISRGGNGAVPGGGGGAGVGGAIANRGQLTIEASTLTGNLAVGGNGGATGVDNNGGFGVDGIDGTFGNGGGGGGFGTLGRRGGRGGLGGFGGGGGGGGGASGGGQPGLGGAGGFGGGNGGNGTTTDTAGGGGGAGLGAAIFNERGTVLIINSTLSGNEARGGTAGGVGATSGSGLGGGLFNHDGSVTVLNATFADNTADQGGGGIYNLGDAATASVNLVNTILADTTRLRFDFVNRTVGTGRTQTTGSHNVIERNSGYTGGIASGSDPDLGPLANNGGPTRTHALRANSPALDRGTNAGAPTVDQRGRPRPANAIVDIGAFEAQAPLLTVTDNLVAVNEGATANNSGTFADLDDGGEVTLTASIGTVTPSVRGSNGTWTWSFRTTDGPDQSQTVTITATSRGGAVGRVTFALNVANVAPTVTLNGPEQAPEDQTVRYQFTTSDPGVDTFTLIATSGGVNGVVSNIVFDPASGNGSFDVRFNNGPGASVVSVQVRDSDGALSNTATFTVTITNRAPSVTLTGPTAVRNGATARYTFVTADAAADTFTLVATSGGALGTVSNVVFDADTGNGSFDVTFGTGPATSTVSVQVRDSDGALSNLASLNVSVSDSSNPTPWKNPANPLDVNRDTFVSPIDVLAIINEINRPQWSGARGELPNPPPAGNFPYLDVNGDNFVAPIDAIQVINHINSQPVGEGESWFATATRRQVRGVEPNSTEHTPPRLAEPTAAPPALPASPVTPQGVVTPEEYDAWFAQLALGEHEDEPSEWGG